MSDAHVAVGILSACITNKKINLHDWWTYVNSISCYYMAKPWFEAYRNIKLSLLCPWDGIGGTLKRAAFNHCLRGNLINDAEKLTKFAKEKFQNIITIYVPKAEILEIERTVLKDRFQKVWYLYFMNSIIMVQNAFKNH